MKELMFTQAESQAFDEEMARDPNVFILGEDIGLYWGGPFGQFRGLIEKYGPQQRPGDADLGEGDPRRWHRGGGGRDEALRRHDVR